MKLIKKMTCLVLLTIVVTIAFSACSHTESYADKLKNQTNYINKLIADSGFIITDTYPKDSIFPPKVFYRDPNTGVYFSVVDSGNGKRVTNVRSEGYIVPNPNVNYRYSNTYILPDDTTNYDLNTSGVQAIQFTYGQTITYTSQSSTSNASAYMFLSPSIVLPLMHVGEGGVVKMIVPFDQGSSFQQGAYLPIYYGRIEYTKIW